MKNNFSRFSVAIAGALLVLANKGALAANEAFILPTVGDPYVVTALYPDATGTPRDALLMNGIPIAFKYDSFWSYSIPVLSAIQDGTNGANYLPTATYGNYSGLSTGTGTIDILLDSGSEHENANNTQSSLKISTSNSDLGWQATWGGITQPLSQYQSDGTYDNTNVVPKYDQTTTVGELLAYLQTLNPAYNVPIIYADYNQTGKEDSLFASAEVKILHQTGVDGSGNPIYSTQGQWALDGINGGTWDPLSPTFNYGSIYFVGANDFGGSAAAAQAYCLANAFSPLTGTGCAGVTSDGQSYGYGGGPALEHNKGSGAPDFAVFADDMNLSLYNPNDIIVMTVRLGCYGFGSTGMIGCNTNGFEEFGILGGVASSRIPEPGALSLLGLGLVAFGAIRRRKGVAK